MMGGMFWQGAATLLSEEDGTALEFGDSTTDREEGERVAAMPGARSRAVAPLAAIALIALAVLSGVMAKHAQTEEAIVAKPAGTLLFRQGWGGLRVNSTLGAQRPSTLFEDWREGWRRPNDTQVTCVTQVCDCSWATGGPLGFCTAVGCPCDKQDCWDCCCKELFPGEYRYAMGMQYLPPWPEWMGFLWWFTGFLLFVLIFGSLFVIVYYCFLDPGRK